MAGYSDAQPGRIRAVDLFESPDYLLHGINFARGTCDFLEVDRVVYEQSSFLDQRIAGSPGRTFTIDLGALVQLARRIPARRKPPAFIAHTSFCCSTLLARSLELPGRTLVLREPQVLLMLARAFREHPAMFPAPVRNLYRDLVFRLLNKSYSGPERVLIKPSNLANRLLEEWLDRETGARGVLITSSLEDYLVSVLRKRAETRAKMPWVAHALAADSDYLAHCPELDRPVRNPLRAAAVAWHAQRYQLGRLVARYAERILPIDQDLLLRSPADVLHRVGRHLRLTVPRAEIEQRVRGNSWRHNAKDPRLSFSPERRRTEYESARRTHAAPIERTIDWISTYLDRLPDPFETSREFATVHSSKPAPSGAK